MSLRFCRVGADHGTENENDELEVEPETVNNNSSRLRSADDIKTRK